MEIFDFYPRNVWTLRIDGHDGGGRWQVSKDGGRAPRWRADGKELFFTNNQFVMAADATLGPSVQFGVPHPLFTGRTTSLMDVAPDGQRFLWADTLEEQPANPIVVVLNGLR